VVGWAGGVGVRREAEVQGRVNMHASGRIITNAKKSKFLFGVSSIFLFFLFFLILTRLLRARAFAVEACTTPID
jgi:hypothetical protein